MPTGTASPHRDDGLPAGHLHEHDCRKCAADTLRTLRCRAAGPRRLDLLATDFFREEVLPLLEAASNAGDSMNEMGTRLIGHMPSIAPSAYVHVVYAPMASGELRELRGRFGRPIPDQYEDFLTCANGLSLFTGVLRVLGYVPAKRRASTGVYNYPTNVIIPNVTARLGGLAREAVVVGWRQAGNCYFAIEKDETVVRLGSSPVESWACFKTWLTAEIQVQTAAHNQSAQ